MVPSTQTSSLLPGPSVINHGGIEGFTTTLAYYRDSKLTIAVLANLNGPASGDIAGKLPAVAHGEAVKLSSERKEITLAPDVLARYVGTYEVYRAVGQRVFRNTFFPVEEFGEFDDRTIPLPPV